MTNLQCIRNKIDTLQNGLLRFHDSRGLTTLHVKASTNEDASFDCIVIEDSFRRKLYNKNVNLIQKRHNDYVYVSGKVAAEVNHNSKILSIKILKACWFERIGKGYTFWLKEKCLFEPENSVV